MTTTPTAAPNAAAMDHTNAAKTLTLALGALRDRAVAISDKHEARRIASMMNNLVIVLREVSPHAASADRATFENAVNAMPDIEELLTDEVGLRKDASPAEMADTGLTGQCLRALDGLEVLLNAVIVTTASTRDLEDAWDEYRTDRLDQLKASVDQRDRLIAALLAQRRSGRS